VTPYFAHSTAVIDAPVDIGEGAKIWHFCHISAGAVLGPGCSLGQNVYVGPGVRLGARVKVQNNVSLYEGVVLEDDVFCGPSCVFTNVAHPRAEVVRRGQYVKTLVQRGATIGANATIVCGHTIGEYAFIGAGAVLTHSVPPYALFIGNPARQAGWVSEYGHKLDLNGAGHGLCPESGQTYQLLNDQLTKISPSE
jgi:UDP-2-acetamido-3-amino-2,3-dideoxy-glucuronate N-acetyltransferase